MPWFQTKQKYKHTPGGYIDSEVRYYIKPNISAQAEHNRPTTSQTKQQDNKPKKQTKRYQQQPKQQKKERKQQKKSCTYASTIETETKEKHCQQTQLHLVPCSLSCLSLL